MEVTQVRTGLIRAVRRWWPYPVLAGAVLASVLRMASGGGPSPVALAIPISLYAIAAHRPLKISLSVLGSVLAVATVWSVYVALDGKTDGVAPGIGGQTSGNVAAEPEVFGPTAWGGIAVLGSLLVVAWAIGWSVRSRRAYLAQQATLAVAAERARITRDVHDTVGHSLAVIVMQAQGGAAAFDKRPADTLAALDTIVATGRASLADIRHVLSEPESAKGLAELPALIDQVRQAGTPVQLDVDGSPRLLPAGIEGSSFRIVQEALTNTMKHAGSGASAQVTVSYGPDELTLEVSDDGVGESASSGRGIGSGLIGIRERAALLGGDVVAGPGPGGGFVVNVRIPLGGSA